VVFNQSPVGLPGSRIGDLVFNVKYCFSGIKSPSVDLVKENMLAIAAANNGSKPLPMVIPDEEQKSEIP